MGYPEGILGSPFGTWIRIYVRAPTLWQGSHFPEAFTQGRWTVKSGFPELSSGKGLILFWERCLDVEGYQVSLGDLQVLSDQLLQNHNIPGNTAVVLKDLYK